MEKYKWDEEAKAFVRKRQSELSAIIKEAENQLRANPAFENLREAEQERDELNLTSSYVNLRRQRVRRFAVTHKSKSLLQVTYSRTNPEGDKSWIHRGLYEYLDVAEQPIQIYGLYYGREIESKRDPGACHIEVFRITDKTLTIQDIKKDIKTAAEEHNQYSLDEAKTEVLFIYRSTNDSLGKDVVWRGLT
jgi:hypothetical protein